MLATPDPCRPAHVRWAIQRSLERCVTKARRPAWLRVTLCLVVLAVTGAPQAAVASTTRSYVVGVNPCAAQTQLCTPIPTIGGPTVAAVLMLPLVSSAQDDSAAVFWQFQDARNQGDAQASMALVASDMQYVDDGPICSTDSPCGGHEAFRRDVQLSISDQVFTSVVGSVDVSGPIVQVRLSSTSPSRWGIGVERTLSDVTIETVDGRITSWRSVSDSADPQTMWWLNHGSSREATPQAAP